MPDIQPIKTPTYDYNKELSDTGISQVPDVTPLHLDRTPIKDLDGPAEFGSLFDKALSQSELTVKQNNPWMARLNMETPINTRLKDTERYNDPNLGFDPLNPNIEYQYGDQQGFLSQWKNNLLKAGANAVGFFADTISTIPSVVGAIKNGDMSKIYNNSVNSGISDWLDNLENQLPNYQSFSERDHPVMAYLNPRYWGNSWGGLIKNLAGVGGAIGSSILEDAAVGVVTEGIGEIPLVASQITTGLGRLARLVSGSEKTVLGLQDALKEGKSVEKAVNALALTAKVTDKTRYGLELLTSSMANGAFQAQQTYKSIYDQLKQDFFNSHGYEAYGEDLARIEDYAKSGGNTDLMAVTAMSTLAHSLIFPTLLKPIGAARKYLTGALTNASEIQLKDGSIDLFEHAVNPSKGVKGLWTKGLDKFGTTVGKGVIAAGDLNAQMVVQRSAENFYEKKYNQQNVDDTDTLLGSLGKGLNDFMFSREGLDSTITGLLTGGIIHGLTTAFDRRRGLNTKESQQTLTALNLLNSNTLTGIFENKYSEAANAVDIQKRMDAAVKNNDIFEYNNLKFQQLYDFVHNGVKSNRYDLRVEQMEGLKKLNDADFKSIFGMEATDDARKSASSFVDTLIDKANKIKKNVDKVEELFKNPHSLKTAAADYLSFEDYKKQLALNLSELEDNRRRMSGLAEKIREASPLLNTDKMVNLTSKEGVGQTIKDFRKRINELKKDNKLAEDVDGKIVTRNNKEIDFLEDKIDVLNSNLSHFDPDVFLKHTEEIMNYYANGNTLNGENEVNPADVVGIWNNASDIHRLHENAREAMDNYRALTTKKGFGEYIARLMKKRSDAADNIKFNYNGDFVTSKDPEPTPPVGDVKPDGTVEAAIPGVEKIDATGKPLTTPTELLEKQRTDDINNIKNDPKLTDEQKEAAIKDTNKEYKAKQEKAKKQREAKTKKTGWESTPVDDDGKDINDLLEDEEKEKLLATENQKTAATKAAKPSKSIFEKINPFTFFNKVFSVDRTDGVKEKANLRNAMFSMSPADLNEKAGITISPSTKGKGGDEFTRIGDTNLYRKGYDLDVELHIDGKVVGRLQPSDSVFFKQGDTYKPLSELAKSEYQTVTGNKATTYEEFMAEQRNYDKVYKKLVDDYSKGKAEVSSDDLQKLFDIVPNYGGRANVVSEKSATLVKNLNLDRTGDAFLSIPMEYDKDSKEFKRGQIAILNSDDFPGGSAAMDELVDFLHNNQDAIKNLNSRYAYLKRLPNGKFSAVSIIAARPARADNETLNSVLRIIKAPGAGATDVEIKRTNANLKDAVYVGDSNNPKGRRTNMFLSLDGQGNSYFNIINEAEGYSKRLKFTQEDLKDVTNFDQLVNTINNRINTVEGVDKGLAKLNLSLDVKDFKKGILDDDKVSTKELASSLTLATTPDVFENFSLGIIPKKEGAAKPAAPKDTVSTKEVAKADNGKVVLTKLDDSMSAFAPGDRVEFSYAGDIKKGTYTENGIQDDRGNLRSFGSILKSGDNYIKKIAPEEPKTVTKKVRVKKVGEAEEVKPTEKSDADILRESAVRLKAEGDKEGAKHLEDEANKKEDIVTPKTRREPAAEKLHFYSYEGDVAKLSVTPTERINYHQEGFGPIVIAVDPDIKAARPDVLKAIANEIKQSGTVGMIADLRGMDVAGLEKQLVQFQKDNVSRIEQQKNVEVQKEVESDYPKNPKEDWQKPAADAEDYGQKRAIQKAILDGKYEKAVDAGDITYQQAVNILKSAGYAPTKELVKRREAGKPAPEKTAESEGQVPTEDAVVKNAPSFDLKYKEGDTVKYNGNDVKINQVETMPDGTQYYVLEGDKIVEAKELEERQASEMAENTVAKSTPEPIMDQKGDQAAAIAATKPDRTANEEVFDYVGLQGVLGRLMEKYGIPYKITDGEGDWKGRIRNGVVEINILNYTNDTPFHEYYHPFVEIMKVDNKALYDNIAKEFGESEEGKAEIERVKGEYPDLNDQEQFDEALVSFMGRAAAQHFEMGVDEKGRPEVVKKESSLNNFARGLFNKFKKWFQDLWKTNNMTTISNIPANASLQDVVDISALHDVKFNLSTNAKLVQELDKYQKDPNNRYDKFMDGLNRRLRVLEDTARRRIGSPVLSDEVRSLRAIIRDSDEVESMNNYIRQGVNSLEYANDEFTRITRRLRAGDLKSDEVSALNNDLNVIKTLTAFYDDVNGLFTNVVDGLDDDNYRHMSEILRKNDELRNGKIKNVSVNLTTEWLYPFVEDLKARTDPRLQDKLPTKEQFKKLLYQSSQDVDGLFYMLGSVGSSSEPVSAIVSNVLKHTVNDTMVKDTRTTQEVLTHYDNFLKEKGLPNEAKPTEDYYKNNYLRRADVYEKVGQEEDGTPKFDYVSRWAFHEKYNFDQFEKEKSDFINSLGEQPDPVEEDKLNAWNEQVFDWYAKNSRMVDGERVPAKRFENEKFAELYGKDKFFTKIYDTYKSANDELGPQALKFGMLPQVSKGKSRFSDLKWDKGVKGNLKVVGEGIKSAFRSDPEYTEGTTKDGAELYFAKDLQNLDGSTYKSIKTAYTRPLEDEDLDFKLPETINKFNSSSSMYKALKDVEPNIQTLKSVIEGNEKLGIEGRKVAQVAPDKKTIFDKVFGFAASKKDQQTRVNKQLLEFIDHVVYGDSKIESAVKIGNFNLSLNKLGDNLGFLTALQNMAGNLNAGLVNVTIGDLQSLGEAIGGRYTTIKDWAAAQSDYFTHLPEFFKDSTSVKKSMLTQLAVHYDAIQGEFRDNFGKKVVGNFAERYATADSLFILSHAGEHQIQIQGMLALMRGQKVPLREGGFTTLRDAWETDANGYAKLKDNVIWSKNDDLAFMSRLQSINKTLNGNYSEFDKTVAQRRWYGKLTLLYRKYLYNAFRSRYGKERFDFELQDVTTGYYRQFFGKLANDIKTYKFDAARKLYTREGWSPEERYAANKTLYEVSMVAGMTMLSIMVGMGEDKSKNKNWLSQELYLQLLRVNNDMSQYSVLGAGDMVRIIKNPSAVMNTLDNYYKFFSQLTTDPYQVYKKKTGHYEKGESVLKARFFRALPIMRQAINFMTPENQIQFYQLTNQKPKLPTGPR